MSLINALSTGSAAASGTLSNANSPSSLNPAQDSSASCLSSPSALPAFKDHHSTHHQPLLGNSLSVPPSSGGQSEDVFNDFQDFAFLSAQNDRNSSQQHALISPSALGSGAGVHGINGVSGFVGGSGAASSLVMDPPNSYNTQHVAKLALPSLFDSNIINANNSNNNGKHSLYFPQNPRSVMPNHEPIKPLNEYSMDSYPWSKANGDIYGDEDGCDSFFLPPNHHHHQQYHHHHINHHHSQQHSPSPEFVQFEEPEVFDMDDDDDDDTNSYMFPSDDDDGDLYMTQASISRSMGSMEPLDLDPCQDVVVGSLSAGDTYGSAIGDIGDLASSSAGTFTGLDHGSTDVFGSFTFPCDHDVESLASSPLPPCTPPPLGPSHWNHRSCFEEDADSLPGLLSPPPSSSSCSRYSSFGSVAAAATASAYRSNKSLDMSNFAKRGRPTKSGFGFAFGGSSSSTAGSEGNSNNSTTNNSNNSSSSSSTTTTAASNNKNNCTFSTTDDTSIALTSRTKDLSSGFKRLHNRSISQPINGFLGATTKGGVSRLEQVIGKQLEDESFGTGNGNTSGSGLSKMKMKKNPLENGGNGNSSDLGFTTESCSELSSISSSPFSSPSPPSSSSSASQSQSGQPATRRSSVSVSSSSSSCASPPSLDSKSRSTANSTAPTSTTLSSSASKRRVTTSHHGPHRCEIANQTTGRPCGKVFSRPYDLIRHQDTIHAPVRKTYTCPVCGPDSKTFSRMDALSRHIRVKHSISSAQATAAAHKAVNGG